MKAPRAPVTRVCHSGRSLLLHEPPNAPAALHCRSLGGQQDVGVADVGGVVQEMGVALSQQFGIDKQPVTAIHISQNTAEPIAGFLIVNQTELPSIDQSPVQGPGRVSQRGGPAVGMIDLGGVDSDVAHTAAILQNDGVPIRNPSGLDRFVGMTGTSPDPNEDSDQTQPQPHARAETDRAPCHGAKSQTAAARRSSRRPRPPSGAGTHPMLFCHTSRSSMQK